MAYKKLPCSELLNNLLDYRAGILYWKKTQKKAGGVNARGYERVYILGDRFATHRIVWKMKTGQDPINQIDHINKNKTDNRIENLRDVTFAENITNQPIRANNTSKVNGVSFHKASNKWRANICSNGAQKHLGLFKSKKEAIAARKSAEKEFGYLTK